jgi:hypothetical protein
MSVHPDQIPDALDAYKKQLDAAKANIERLQTKVHSLNKDLGDLSAIIERLAAKYPKS